MLCLLCALLLLSCAKEDKPTPAQERSTRLGQASGDIVVGVSWMWSKQLDLMRQGVEMAADQINGAGGINGRKLRLIWGDDNEQVKKGIEVAQGFVANAEMVAAIGHSTSSITAQAPHFTRKPVSSCWSLGPPARALPNKVTGWSSAPSPMIKTPAVNWATLSVLKASGA